MQNLVNKPFLYAQCLLFAVLLACSSEPKTQQTDIEKKTQFFSETEGSFLKFDENVEWDEDWSDENQVRIQISTPISQLHPTNGISAGRFEVITYIHEGLIAEDIAKLGYKPLLLKAMPTLLDSGKKLKMHLNTKAKFDDGAVVSSKDIAFTYKVNICPFVNNGSSKSRLSLLDSIIVVDDSTLIFSYQKPSITNISNLVNYPILQQNKFDKDGLFDSLSINKIRSISDTSSALASWAINFNDPSWGSDIDKLSGLGAYKVVELSDQKLVLAKKKNHWLKKNNNRVDKIIFKVNRDQNTQALEIVRGEVDVVTGLGSQVITKLFEDENVAKNYFVGYLPVYGLNFLVVNNKPSIDRKQLFVEPEMRKAMAHLLRVDDVIQNLSDGKAQAIAGPISILKDENNTNLKPIEFNLQRANEILDSLNWIDTDADGIRDKIINGEKVSLEFSILCRSMPVLWRNVCEILISRMNEAGVSASVDVVDASVWGTALTKTKDFDMLLISIGTNYGPEYPLALFDSREYPNGSNFSGYSNPLVDSLIDLVDITLEYNERKKVLYELQEIIYKDQPYLFLTTSKRGVLVHKRFKNTNVFSAIPFVQANELQIREKPLK